MIVYCDVDPKLFRNFRTMPAATLNQLSIFKRISELAKREWINAGRSAGRDLEFWLIAEREICCFVDTDGLNFGSPDGCYRINRKHPNETWHLEWA